VIKNLKHNYFYTNTNVVVFLLTIKYSTVPAELINCSCILVCVQHGQMYRKNKTIKYCLLFLQTFLNINEFNKIQLKSCLLYIVRINYLHIFISQKLFYLSITLPEAKYLN